MTLRVSTTLLLSLICACHADMIDDALKYSGENAEHIDDDLLKLASIPSISSLPEHAKDIIAASEWLLQKLKGTGLEVQAVPTVSIPGSHYTALNGSQDRHPSNDETHACVHWPCRMFSSCQPKRSPLCMLNGSKLETYLQS